MDSEFRAELYREQVQEFLAWVRASKRARADAAYYAREGLSNHAHFERQNASHYVRRARAEYRRLRPLRKA